MRNSYLFAAVVVLVAILGFVFASKKTEAPSDLEQNMQDNKPQNVSFNDGVYKLDAASSTLHWEGEYLVGLKEEGTVKFLSAEVAVEGGAITKGEFEVDMNSIESIPRKDMLENHLKNADFFEVGKYPTSKFVLKSVAPTSAEGAEVGRFVLAGDMTVKGISRPISFIATINQEEGGLRAESSFAINRADWEIKYNSPTFFQELGDKVIRDAVILKLDLKAEKVIQ